MSLTSLELDLLVAIDRLTSDSYLPAEQDDVFAELARMGVEPPHAMWLYYAAQQLGADGYIEADFAGGMILVNLKLTREGREAARTVFDPMEKVLAESRVKIGSEAFAAAFPGRISRGPTPQSCSTARTLRKSLRPSAIRYGRLPNHSRPLQSSSSARTMRPRT